MLDDSAKEFLKAKNFCVFEFDEVSSTNDECAKILKNFSNEKISDEKSGFCARAILTLTRRQTNGRGRLGRKWISKEGSTLCASFGFVFKKRTPNIASFTTRAGFEICEALSKKLSCGFFVKWPNDIYSPDGGKIAGMLAELEAYGDEMRLVFGVGMNLDLPPENEDFGKNKVSSLKKVFSENGLPAEKFPSLDEIILLLAECFLKTAENIEKDFFYAPELDFLRGKKVSTEGEKREGIACGISENGELLFKCDSGKIEKVNSGEVLIARH